MTFKASPYGGTTVVVLIPQELINEEGAAPSVSVGVPQARPASSGEMNGTTSAVAAVRGRAGDPLGITGGPAQAEETEGFADPEAPGRFADPSALRRLPEPGAPRLPEPPDPDPPVSPSAPVGGRPDGSAVPERPGGLGARRCRPCCPRPTAVTRRVAFRGVSLRPTSPPHCRTTISRRRRLPRTRRWTSAPRR